MAKESDMLTNPQKAGLLEKVRDYSDAFPSAVDKGKAMKAVAAYVESLLAAERTAVIEGRAKAMCAKCAAGDRPDFQSDPQPMWWHKARECKAASIRALLAVAPTAPDGKLDQRGD
jgi:hypothetical protein